MKLKGLHFVDVAGIQETVTNELQKVQKEEFSAASQKLYDRSKACIYGSGPYFELKKRHASSSRFFDIKKTAPNIWTALYIYIFLKNGSW